MSDFYGDMQGIASSLLKEFKQGAVFYVEVIPGTGTVDAPGPPTEIMHEIDAAVRGVSFKYVNNTTVLTTDLQATFSVIAGVQPSADGFILMDGKRQKIVSLMPIPAAGTPIAYVVIFRK